MPVPSMEQIHVLVVVPVDTQSVHTLSLHGQELPQTYDIGFTEKWRIAFLNCQLSSSELPPLNQLAEYIKTALPVKISMHPSMRADWSKTMALPSELMDKLFILLNSEPCIDLLYNIKLRFLASPYSGTSEASFIPFWDDVIRNVLTFVLSDDCSFDRNSSSSSSTGSKPPDFLFFVDSICVFIGEEKFQGFHSEVPRNELLKKLNWKYENIPYLLAYTAVGFVIRLYAIYHEPRDKQIHSKELAKFNLLDYNDQFRLFLAMLNISRLLRGLASLCPPELNCGARALTRSHGILVSIEFDQVVKVFPPSLFRGAKAHAEAVYKVLRDNKVPNVDSLISANSRKFQLKFKPRGNDIRPSTLDELFLCLLDIFAALVELHKLSWMHRDIRWSNVMKRYGCSNSWFLIDFMDAAESPQCHDCEERLSQEEHAPEIFGNGNHTVAVDIWSVGYLIQSSNCEWCDLGKEQSDFLNLLMDSDPSKRPNAKVALKKVRHFKIQYENQSLETREKPAKRRREKIK